MFGRLSQLAQNVQNSFNADEGDGSPSKGADKEKTIAMLQADLEQAEERNKSINIAFKKLLKEKEQEIKRLQDASSKDGSKESSDVQESRIPSVDVESWNQMKRKNEEYQMLIEQKDETIQMLMANVKEAEDLRDKVEQQERINTEKLMFELAERIKAHENIQRKLEETKHVMEEKDNAIHNMADQMAAQDKLLKAREDSIKKLKRMAAGNETSEDMIVTLQKAVQEKDNRLNQMAQLIDKLEVEKKLLDAKINNRDGLETSKDQTIKTLWSEIEQKNEMIQKMTAEKDDLLVKIQKREEEIKARLDANIEKDSVVDELTVKIRSLEKELNLERSDIEVSSEGASREIGHLKEQLAELNEILRSKSQTIDMFQKEIEEKDLAYNDLRQKLNALHKLVEEKDENAQEMSRQLKKMQKEKDEFKEKFETEASEKKLLKEQMDRVGSELSQQLDKEGQKVADLLEKLHELENESIMTKGQLKDLSEELANCKELRSATVTDLDKEREKVKEVEKTVELLQKESLQKSEELDKLRRDLETKNDELEAASKEVEMRNDEIQSQRERFDAELSMLQSTSESEKGNTASLLKDLEHVRRDLDVAIQERDRFERESEGLKKNLEARESRLEELQVDFDKSHDDSSKLKEIINTLEGRIKELAEVERVNESLSADIARERASNEEEKQFKLNLEKECDQLRKDLANGELALDEGESNLLALQKENSSLTELAKELEEKLKTLDEERKSIEVEKEGVLEERDNQQAQLSLIKNEYLDLNEKVKAMESSMNHMIEKLNAAELKVNESMHEKEALEEKLRLTLEERTQLASQKSDIEVALEEFVRSTGSRRKISGRSSVDGSEGARSTPNEGLSGYNTPVSKEGSPRNSAYVEAFQPSVQPAPGVGGLFEGKAIGEIFRLVEEERKALENNLSAANKERDQLSAKNSELEDYLDLEKQKFKQASEEISFVQQNIQQLENDFTQQLYSLQEECASLRYTKEELERRLQQDAEAIESITHDKERLEAELRQTEDKLADKALELSRLGESCDQMQAELGSKEEQLEKATKQNKQMKNKLKELLKERSEREKTISEKDARIAELDGLSVKLDSSTCEIERLESEIRERDTMIESLEAEKNERCTEVTNLGNRVMELEDDANKIREMSAQEVYAVNEKMADLERSFREIEDINSLLKGEVDGKIREIQDLGSISSVQKEELANIKTLLLQKDEEIAVMRNSIGLGEQKVHLLTEELNKANEEVDTMKKELDTTTSLHAENKNVIKTLNEEIAASQSKLQEVSNNLESEKMQSSRQVEYVSKLEGDLSEMDNELLKIKGELAQSEDATKKKINELSVLEEEIAKLKSRICDSEEDHSRVIAENERKLLKSKEDADIKDNELQRLTKEKERLDSKIADLEQLLIGKDEGLEEIINVKNTELEQLKDEVNGLRSELVEYRKSVANYQEKLSVAENLLEEHAVKSKEAEEKLTELITAKDVDISRKAGEIADLTESCNEKSALVEKVQQELDSVQEKVKQLDEICEASRQELDEKNERYLLLEKNINELEGEKLRYMQAVEARDSEIQNLNNQVESDCETIRNLTEEVERHKQAAEEHRVMMEQRHDESGSQIESLTCKMRDLLQEKEEKFQLIDTLKNDLEIRSRELSDSEEKMSALITTKESLEEEVTRISRQLEEQNEAFECNLKELDQSMQKINACEDMIENIQRDKELLASDLKSNEAKIEDIKIEKAEIIKNLNEEIETKVAVIKTLNDEVQSLQDRVESLDELNSELDKSVAGKDDELNALNDKVLCIDQLRRDLDVSEKEKEEIKSENAATKKELADIERQFKELQEELARCDQEFEAERDIVAAKISDLRAEIERLLAKESNYQLDLEQMKAEIDRMQAEARSRDELISLKSEELEMSKSMTEKLESEEIAKLHETVNEKAKHFEEYKGKVLKKMKSMKDETKKLNVRIEELTEKERRLSEVELDLEAQRSERQNLESVLVEVKSELEILNNERQNLSSQIDLYKHKILEIENLNVSREENIRNLETEIARYHRLLQDKDEELNTVKEMMHNSMEEIQAMQDSIHKKEEKIKVLQEQLMTNEEDFSSSFTEKENRIEELNMRVQKLQGELSEKESESLDLSRSAKDIESKVVELENTNSNLNAELLAANEAKMQVIEENAKLMEKVAGLTDDLYNFEREKNEATEELQRIKQDFAAKVNDASLKEKEIERLRDEMQKITEEQLGKSPAHVDQPLPDETQALLDEKEGLLHRIASLSEENRLISLDFKEKSAELDLLTEQLERKVIEMERLQSQPDANLDVVIKPYIQQISELQDEAEKKKKTFDEYKSKASKRMKTLKEENAALQRVVEELNEKIEGHQAKADESLLVLEKENETLSVRLVEIERECIMQKELVNNSSMELEVAHSQAKASATEVESARSELAKVKQRLSDKEEEILTIKEMMHVSISEMQVLQEELNVKDHEIETLKGKEDALNCSMLSLNEELASIKDEYTIKKEEFTSLEYQLSEAKKQVDILQGRLEHTEQSSSGTSGASGEEGIKANEERVAEIERESEAIKLKLAKAIKRMGTMKKDLQSKEDVAKSLEEQIVVLRSSVEELKEKNQGLELELSQSNDRTATLAEELKQKEESIREVIPEVIVPSFEATVSSETGDGWGDFGGTDVEDGRKSPIKDKVVDEVVERVPEEAMLLGAAPEESANEHRNEEIEMLKKDNDEVSESLKKSNEMLEKAKKKIAMLKKSEVKRGKEMEELRVSLADMTARKDDEISELATKIRDLDERFNEKESQVSSLSEQNEHIKGKLEETLKKCGKLEMKNDDLKRLVEVMAEEKHDLDDEMKDLLSEIKDVMDIKNKLLTDLQHANDTIASKEAESANLKDVLSVKEGELAASEWKLQELESLQQEVAEIREEKLSINEELTSKMNKLHELENLLRLKDTENASMKDEISKLMESHSKEESLLSELQEEIMKRDESLKELPDQETLMELKRKEESLEENLRVSNDEVRRLRIENNELENLLNKEKAVNSRLEEERAMVKNELNSEIENYCFKTEDLNAKLRKAEEDLQIALENIKENSGLESLSESLKEELNDKKMMVDDLNRQILTKNEEMESINARFLEAEEELKRRLDEEMSARNYLEEEVGNMKKTIDESLSESERSILNSAIEELKLNSSQREEALNEEIHLLKEKLQKEQEIVNEQSRIEHADLVKSFEEKTQTVDELQANAEKLNETIVHKDTVIAKLKLKLKQTIKDRDVMKGNLQSEIERLSQEKDVIFNEFQAKAQQTKNEAFALEAEYAELKTLNNELGIDCKTKEKSLEERDVKIQELSKELEEVLKDRTDVSSKISSLESRIVALEQEAEAKEELIDKYEWENSEKENRIRDLEREARFFEDRKAEWDELKRTFEDTIEVKEKIMENLQSEIEKSQAKKFKDSQMIEDKLNEFEKQSADLKDQLKGVEDKLKSTEVELELSKRRIGEIEEEKQNVFKVLGMEFDEDGEESRNIFDVVLKFKAGLEKEAESKNKEIRDLEDDFKRVSDAKNYLEQEMNNMKEETEVEIGNALQNISDEYDLSEDRSLRNILGMMVSERSVYKKKIEELNGAILATKNSNDDFERQVEDLKRRLEEDLVKHEKEKSELKESKELDHQEDISSLNDKVLLSERLYRELEEKHKNVLDEISFLKEDLEKRIQIIEELNHEKATLEKKSSEMEHKLDLAELETQQVKIDKDNIERQMEIMIQEAESLKSSALPEMQALVAAKNTAMLELRENFSDVISDKDSIISTMRAKITELQQGLAEGAFNSKEEVDALKSLIDKKDDDIAKLKRDFANIKRSRDWLQTELSKTIKEKNNIGGSIQTEFESISKGLRGDIELFMEDKKAFEREFQLERLQLERKIAEQGQSIDSLQKDIGSRDDEISQLNFVVAEMKRRVENAADILSKEDYYRQLEERIDELYGKLKEANESVREVKDRLREEKATVEDLEVKLDISNRERSELVLVYEGKMQKLENDHAEVCQSLRLEIQELNQWKTDQEKLFESKIEEVTRYNEFTEQRLKEEFDADREELTRRIAELSANVENLEKEKQETRENVINEVMMNADEKMVRLQSDYERIISDKNYRIDEFAERIGEMQERLVSLTASNTNLSKNLFAIDNENGMLKKDVTNLSNIHQQSVSNHKAEIEDLLMKKGKDFKALRTQFEEALEEKEKILSNLQNKLKELRGELEVKYNEDNQFHSDKEMLVQENIKKDLMYERLKVNVDSLLNSVFEMSDGRVDVRKVSSANGAKFEKETGENIGDEEINSAADENIAKDIQIKGFESAVSEARAIVDGYLQSKKVAGETQEGLEHEIWKMREELKRAEEENACLNRSIIDADEANEKRLMQVEMDREQLLNTIKNLHDENSMLQETITEFNAKSIEPSSDLKKDEKDGDGKIRQQLKEDFEDTIIPTSVVELTTANREETDSDLMTSMKAEIASLKAENEQIEKTRKEIERSVRKDFDDILQNLREDLQNAMNENKNLMNENFLLKNVKSKGVEETGLEMKHFAAQTEDKQAFDFHAASGMSSSFDASSQTEDFRRDSDSGETLHVKRYNSSDRLPEVVEDTLYSKLSFEQLQTFSDSALDGEPFSGHAKLELRLGEEDGDRSVNVADLQHEVENLNSKLQQSKKMIVKMKQMTKKYKTELTDLQAEKFEQIRVYEEAINATKQEIEESNLEKVRKDQEIRSLREEVRLLVKEKAEVGDAVRARIDAIIADHSKQASDLAARNDQEFAKKEEVIRMLYDLKSENDIKAKKLNNELNVALEEKEKAMEQMSEIQSMLDDRVKDLAEKSKECDELNAKHNETGLRLLQTEEEKSRLEEKLRIEKKDVLVDNARFDDEIIEGYVEELERINIELQEAFDLIRALESNQQELEHELESRTVELNSVIDSREDTIERMSAEKIEIEKSMQEMREEVQRTVEEKDKIVGYWKKENEKLVADNEVKFSEKIEMSQRSIEECQTEIIALREQKDSQNAEIDMLRSSLDIAETTARNLSERNENFEQSLANLQSELGRALEEKGLLQDKLAFFEHQVEGMKTQHERELHMKQNDVEKVNEALESLRLAFTEKETLAAAFESEVQLLKNEVAKGKKKAKRLKREMEASKRTSQDLADGIRVEMEKVVSEVQDEKALLHSDVLSKESQLQEIRIHADQLMQERERWNSRMRASGPPVQAEILVSQGDDIEMGFTDKERLSLQVNQLKAEKDQIVANLEDKIAKLSSENYELEKKKRTCELEVGELQARLNHLQKQGVEKEKSQYERSKIESYGADVKSLKGDIEILKQEASGFAGTSKMLLGQMESELTSLLMNAAQGQLPMVTLPVSGSFATERGNLSSDERLKDNNSELEEAKEQISMLKDSLHTWKERCSELEVELEQQGAVNETFERRGSQEFLINIDDEGPSIETARPHFGERARRLMKYSTSGMSFKTRARSFLSSFTSKQRGMLPVRRLVLMAYILAIHILAFMSLYGFLH